MADWEVHETPPFADSANYARLLDGIGPEIAVAASVLTVAVVSPPADGEVDEFGALVIDATSTDNAPRVIVVAVFPSQGIEEVVHNGQHFASHYTGRSTRVAIDGGFRFSILRNGGWFENPRLEFYELSSEEG